MEDLQRRKLLIAWLATIAAVGVFVVLAADMAVWKTVLSFLFPDEEQVIYPRANLATLLGEHLGLVLASSAASIAIGVPLGTVVTRRWGRSFLDLVEDLTSLGQTIPPVAVLALAVPLMGFGFEPTVVALFLYSILPIVRNTIAGLDGVPRDLIEAARGMGMTAWQCLVKIEFPLAVRVIMAGIRISVVINVGTATVGAVIGAGGLGSPIVAGLVQQNPAFVLEGAIAGGMLAILADQLLARTEASLTVGIDSSNGTR